MSTRCELAALAAEARDLLIIGGGAYGVCAAWEAAQRGLSVALIERGDFGEATSSSSLHTMHGGLRYLQHLDLRRMRESIRERRFWLRAAPTLISPMAFVLPTQGHGLRGPEALQIALAMNDLISSDRNRGVSASARLPRGRRLSRAEARRRLASLQLQDFNGAALWYDGFNRSPERLIVALLQTAAAAGARLMNYCVAEELLRESGRITGAVARDLIGGQVAGVRARHVLNATGPWVDWLADMAGRRASSPLFRPSKAINLVVRRLPLDAAVGVPVPRRGRETDALLDKGTATYFIMPWGEYSLIGTKHLHFEGGADSLCIEPQDIAEFLGEINPALGSQRLSVNDVVAVKCGLLPEQAGGSAARDVVLQKHGRIVDHEAEDGIAGLTSLVGVKWTTARLVAEQAVRQICVRLGREDLAKLQSNTQSPLQVAAVGSDTGTQIEQAVRHEWAVHLSDVVMRRTDLWLQANVDRGMLEAAAAAMARAHGWSIERIGAEIDATQSLLQQRQSWRAAAAAIM